jgi:hypothetical protein
MPRVVQAVWEDDLHWYFQCAEGELGVRGMGFERTGVPVAPHERSSAAQDNGTVGETAAQRERRVREILEDMPEPLPRILLRYYSWEPNRATMTVQDRAKVERVRLTKVTELLKDRGIKHGTEDTARWLTKCHDVFREKRKEWRTERADAKRRARERYKSRLLGLAIRSEEVSARDHIPDPWDGVGAFADDALHSFQQETRERETVGFAMSTYDRDDDVYSPPHRWSR